MIKRWARNWRNRRAYFKVGKAYLYLWKSTGYVENPEDSVSKALDVLIGALQELNLEYERLQTVPGTPR